MESDYWKGFWLSHATKSRDEDLQIQVLRTLNKQPITQEKFSAIVDSIVALLKPERRNNLLDLCCGNGVITNELSGRVKTVTAVDLSQEFISQLNKQDCENITALTADARTVEFPAQSFDRILLYAGVQYFSDSEIIDLFLRMKYWMRDGGLAVLGDIPDVSHKWDFYDSLERENAYFQALRKGKPIVGNWLERTWLKKLANYAGFRSSMACNQSEDLPYSHYRFDLVLKS